MSALKNIGSGGIKLVAVDNNIPALASTKQKDGTTYIFYYIEGQKISYLLGAEVTDYAEKTVKLNNTAVIGSNSPLAASTWNDSVRLYYIDSSQLIHELGLGSDGKWFSGALTDKKYKSTTKGGLYAAGNADHQKDGGNITVLFFDADNDGQLTQATIDTKTREWTTVVVSN